MIPTAIIFINSVDGYTLNSSNDNIKSTLINQLHINEYMTDKEFDNRVLAMPTYIDTVHLQGLRIMVGRDDLRDYTNRNLADIVLFYSHGMINVEKNNFGPPGLTIPIDRLNIYALLRTKV